MLEQMKLAAEDPLRRCLGLAVDGFSISHSQGTTWKCRTSICYQDMAWKCCIAPAYAIFCIRQIPCFCFALLCFALLCFALLGATHGSVCTREFMVLPLGGGWHSYTYLSMHYGLPICTGGVGGALCFDVCMNEALEEFLKWRSHLF
jgi:hypothetical protein